MFSSPVCHLPVDTPAWAKCLHDSLHRRIGDLESSVNDSINFAVEEAQNALKKGAESEKQIAMLIN